MSTSPEADVGCVKSPSLFGSESELPKVSFSFKQRILKGEDMALAAAPVRLPGNSKINFQLFAVFDGHSGDKTARFCKKHLLDELHPRLPDTEMPTEADSEAFQAYLKKLQEAMLDTFLALNRKSIAADCNSGCTATVLLVTGWLATVANVGDSAMVMHSVDGTQRLTADHRLDHNVDECLRLEAKGYRIARLREDLQGPMLTGGRDDGFGPLRAWPGSLAMARAIGDADAGLAVLPYPHIAQIRIPDNGARFVIASDGLWDSKLGMRSIVSMARRKSLRKLSTLLVREAVRSSGLIDDTTVMCIDVVPASKPDIRETLAAASGKAGLRERIGCFGCGFAAADDQHDVHLHYSKVHTDQLVEPSELESIEGSVESLTRMRSISISTQGSGASVALQHLPSLDGLTIFQSIISPKQSGSLRVLTRRDTLGRGMLGVTASISKKTLIKEELQSQPVVEDQSALVKI